MAVPGYLWSDAVISDCGVYRYELTRIWDKREGRACFLMLNPSTADASIDDPTVRRCIGFAKRWNLGGLVVVNLFALRSTSPGMLYETSDPIGPRNDAAILKACESSAIVVAAWGIHGRLNGRGKDVKSMLRANKVRVHHLGLSMGPDPQPKHPLYLAGDTTTEILT